MWLGKNPGGGPEVGDVHRAGLPFQLALAPRWSAYLDLQWAGHPRGPSSDGTRRPGVGSAVRGVGRRGAAAPLEPGRQTSIPFRSERPGDLPRGLRGVEFGVQLVRLAQPRILVLLCSDDAWWTRLMTALGRETAHREPVSAEAGYYIRESVNSASCPSHILALPGAHRPMGQNGAVLATLRERFALHGLTLIGTGTGLRG